MPKKMFIPLLIALILVFIALVGLAPRTGLSSGLPQDLSPHQEVQRQVNQSLLRATVLMATYAGLIYKDGVDPATPTAIWQEMIDNFATVEALRPRAIAEQIILLQDPIQPTLESEATLFAEAYTASAPFAGYQPPTITPLPPGTLMTATPYEGPTAPIPYPYPYPRANAATATPYERSALPALYPYPPAEMPAPYP